MSSKDFFEKLTNSVGEAELRRLVEEAAPVMAVLAYRGGSLFARKWLETARVEFGIETPIPETNLPDDGA